MKTSAPKSAAGTAKITINGSTKDSYWAQSTRYVKTSPSKKMSVAREPAVISSSDKPDHSYPTPGGSNGLTRAVAGCGVPADLDGAIQIVMGDERRPFRLFDANETAERDNPARRRANVQPPKIGEATAERCVGLRVDAIRPVEIFEIVDVVGAQLGLQGSEEIVERNADGFRLIAVDVDLNLRRVITELREHLRCRTARLIGEPFVLVEHVHELVIADVAAVLELEREAADVADAVDRRRVEGDDLSLGDLRHELSLHAVRTVENPDDRRIERRSLVPRFEQDEHHAAIGSVAGKAEPADIKDVGNAGLVKQNLFRL